jgi:transcriptional regulator GlxA family with amidase domain
VRWQNRVVDIAIPLYEDFAALDAVGPYEVLSRLPGSEVHFVAKEAGPVRTETGMLSLNANRELSSLPSPEVIVVPGGIGNRALLEDEELLGWIARAHERTTWTTSVCTGSLLLGAAGVLDGLGATTYWLELETLRQFGATPSNQRVVEQGKVITAAGVSAGIDMALVLADRIAGADVAQAIQLGIEYDPKPPFDAGSPGKAPAHVVELVREAARAATRP